MSLNHAGLAGADTRARPWRWLVGGLLALMLAGCGGGGDIPVPDAEGTRVEGRVVAESNARGFSAGPDDSSSYRLTAYDRRGKRLGSWSTAADGSFRHTLLGQAPFRIEAASDANGVPLTTICDGRGTVHCDITPWTSLIVRASDDTNNSPADIAAMLYALPFFNLAEGEDPFLLYRDGLLEPGRFDVEAVLTLMNTPEGLDQWLQTMSLWLADPDASSAPAGVPRVTITTQVGAGGVLEPATRTLARGDVAVFQVAPAVGHHLLAIEGCGGEYDADTGLFTTGVVTNACSLDVTFEINQYDLTYGAGDNGALSGPAVQQVTHGGDGESITAVADTGYHFVQWSDGVTANPRQDLVSTGDVSVNAQFAINQYSLSYGAGANGSLSGQTSQQVDHGQNGGPVMAIPDTGYHFVRWSDLSVQNPRADSAVTANLDVTAQFTINEYQLVYAAGAGGSLSGASPQVVAHGGSGTAVTATPDSGYHFVAWSDGGSANPRQDSGITGSINATATFAINQYQVAYSAGAGGAISGDQNQTVNHGKDATAVTAVADSGYRFDQWSDGHTDNPRSDTGLTADLNVAARFSLKQYSLVYTSEANGALQGQASQTVEHGGDGTAVTAQPESGYQFVAWSDGSTANPRIDTNVGAALSVSARFTVRQYALTYGAGAGGSLTGSPAQTVDHGAAGSAVEAVPDTGYRFVQWSDGGTANPRTDSGVTADVSVLAEFAVLEFTLTYSAAAGGTLNGSAAQTVEYGNDGSAVEAVPDTGRNFTGWSDGGSANPRTDSNITADLTVQALFEVTQYTLTYSAGAGGSLSGSASQTVDHGDDGSPVLAVADTGYHFVYWNDSSVANPRTDASVGGDLVVEARFEVNQYTLTYAAGVGGSVTGVSPQTVSHGAAGSAVTAVADSGYHFKRWSDGVTDNPRTDTGATASLTVTAQFAADGLVLAVDEKHFAALETSELTVLNTGAETAEYVLIPMNLTRSAQALPVSVALTNGVDAPVFTALTDAPLNGVINERAAQKADALARLGTVGAEMPMFPGAGIPAGVPLVGDLWEMNVNLTDNCGDAVTSLAEVKVVSTHAVILEDMHNPPGGFPVDNGSNNHDYTEIASLFDTSVYPAGTQLLGDTPDRDGNGRVVLFYTQAVNELDAPGASAADQVPAGRYRVRDRLSSVECPGSNGGEVVYMKVPDPTGMVNGNVRTVSNIMGQAGIQAAMEMALMIADDRQLLAGPTLPEGWIDNGLATLGTGSVFYQNSVGLQPLHRITLSDLTSGANASRRVAAYNAYQNLMFGELRGWLQYPWRAGLVSASERDTRARGVAWAFLRYASDRQAMASNDPPLVSVADQFAYQLAGSGQGGWATLDGLTGDATSEWLRDFLVTFYLDGPASSSVSGYLTAPSYRMASWDFQSVYGGLGGHPLTAQTLSQGQGRSLNLAGAGGALYVRFSVAAGDTSVLAFETTPSGGEDARFALVRLK